MVSSRTKKQVYYKDDVCGSVIRTIEKKDIKMKPKHIFLVSSLVASLTIGALLIFAVFLLNIKLYYLEMTKPLDWLSFGSAGLWPFIVVFPWKLLLLSTAAIMIGTYLLRSMNGVAHLRTMTIIATMAMLVMALSWLFYSFKVHAGIAYNKKMMGLIYNKNFVGSNWLSGCVDKVRGGRLTVSEYSGKEYSVDMAKVGKSSNGPIVANKQIEMLGYWKNDQEFVPQQIRMLDGQFCTFKY